MAKLYGEIASSALMTFDKSFARANGQPLDSTEVYYSYDSAVEYASGAGAYIGQKIVVIEDGVITHYSIEDTNGTLKELGAKPVGDGLTITILDDGKISLANIPEVQTDEDGNDIPATYNAVLVNGELTWVKPSATTVEGLNDLIVALTGRVDKAEVDITNLKNNVGTAAKPESSEGAGDAVEATGLYKLIADEEVRAKEAEKALDERIGAIDFIDETELEDVLEDYATIEYVDEKFDSIEIPVVGINANDKILTLGSDKLISATVSMSYDEDSKAIKLYGKDNVELGSVDATPFIKDGMLNDVEYDADSNTLTFKWNTDSGISEDTVVLSDIIEPYTAGNGLDLSNNEFSVKISSDSENFLTVTEDGLKLLGISDAITNAKNEAISDAEGKIATAKTEAATDATNKANQALADAKTDAANLYATKTYVGTIPSDEKYNDVTNVISYVNKKAEEVLSQATGGSSESAASVKAQLDTYKAENDPKVNKNIEDIIAINSKLTDIEANAEVNIIEVIKVNGTEQSVLDKVVDITVPTKYSDITDDSGFDARITAAQNQADKGVNDASAAQTTANEAKSTAEGNTTAINEVNAIVSGHTTSINDHLGRITVLENANEAHKVEYQTLNEIVSGHTSEIAKKASQTDLDSAIARISTNESKLQTLTETTIPTINEELLKKANASNVYTKDEIKAITGDLAKGKTLVQMIADAQTAATYNDTQVKADIKANTDAIAILNSDDKTVGSVDYKVAQEVAKILNDSDDSDIDTLNEIAAWIINDTTGAAKMNADIVKNTSDIAILNGGVDVDGSVLSMIAANAPSLATTEIAGLVKSVASTVENGISVGNDGTMSVNSVNVNKLVQTDGEFLVLNGGSANE